MGLHRPQSQFFNPKYKGLGTNPDKSVSLPFSAKPDDNVGWDLRFLILYQRSINPQKTKIETFLTRKIRRGNKCHSPQARLLSKSKSKITLLPQRVAKYAHSK
jgi:hypothetical protein